MVFIYGLLFICILSSIGKHLYSFTKMKFFALLFSSGNDLFSYYKLGITPLLIYFIVEKYTIVNNNLISIKGISMLTYILIISIIYILIKLIKKEIPNISISYIYLSLFISELIAFLLINDINLSNHMIKCGNLIFYLIIILFIIFNYKYLLKH